MKFLPTPIRWNRPIAVALLFTLAVPSCVRAEDVTKAATSLKWIPASAAFYSVSLRNREQFDIILKSKAWAKLQSMPSVQLGWKLFQEQMKQAGSNPNTAGLLQLYKLPENQELIKLLGEMISDEIFCYGDESVIQFTQFAYQLSGNLQYAPYMAGLTGQDPNKAALSTIMKVINANPEGLRLPNFVIGFRINDTKPALAQLGRLEKLLNQLAQQAPPLQGHVKRGPIAGGDFISVALDGSMVPWDQVNLKQFEQNEGDLEPVIKKLRALKLTFSIGVRENFVLLSLGDSNAALEKLSDSGSHLAELPEMKVLERFTDKRLTSIGYASKAIKALAIPNKKDVNNFVQLAQPYLQKAELPAEQQDKIRKDLQEFAKDLITFYPEAGAAVDLAFMTDRGQEAFTFDRTVYPKVSASEPLRVLNHLGGSPLAALVMRTSQTEDMYKFLVKWLKVGNRYFEDLVVPKLDENQRAQYEQLAKVVHPFLQRIDKATTGMLLPACRDGQRALVLDAKIESKQWHQMMPQTDKPMAMIEPACVIAVSDAALLRKGFAEYRQAVNELITKLHELSPQIPDFQLPEPESRKVESGDIFFYSLPEQAGLDKQLLPNAALSSSVFALTISESQSQRILKATPLKVSGGPLADPQKPLVSASYLDWAGLIRAASPWVEMGVKVGLQSQAGGDGDSKLAMTPEQILSQVHTGLELLQVFQTFTSCSYFEDKVLVTHSETVFKDL